LRKSSLKEIKKWKKSAKKYENIIQDLKQKNLNPLEKLSKEPEESDKISKMEEQNVEREPRNLEALKESLIRVSTGLDLKWNKLFKITGKDFLSITQKQNTMISDQKLKDFIEDLIQVCSKEDLWKNLDRLDIRINGQNYITDEGLKELALKLGPQLSNLQHLAFNMSRSIESFQGWPLCGFSSFLFLFFFEWEGDLNFNCKNKRIRNLFTLILP